MHTAVAKWQKPATAAVASAAAGKQQPNILYMQCLRDGVQQTAMQMGVSVLHITFSVQSSRTASEHLGRTYFAHYISYILFSIFQQIVSSIKMIYKLVYIPINYLMHTGLTGILCSGIMKRAPEIQITNQLPLLPLTLTE